MKIVVAGPPHSGKSVFLGGLCDNLPRDRYFLFRACPDGEGSWTWKGNGAEKHRRKGSFTAQQVNWYIQSLKGGVSQLAELVLVDIGGRCSEENRRILVEGGVTGAIILAGDLAAVPEWQAFLEACHIPVLQVIHSDYHAGQDDVSSSPMVVHHLERGEDVSTRPTIQRVASMLVDMLDDRAGKQPAKEEGEMQTLKISALAQLLGKTPVERTLPNGSIVTQLVWVGSDLVELSQLLHNHSAEYAEHVLIDGPAPAWLVAGLVHELHPRHCSVPSPDGPVPIGCGKPSPVPTGENLDWKVEEGPQGWTVVTVQQRDPSIPLDPEDLGNWAPPQLPMHSKVILSGRMPNWGMASVAMAYHGNVAAVALFQPGTGATVAWTHTKKVGLGTVIEMN